MKTTTSHSKSSQVQCLKHCCCCLRCGSFSSGLMASPQLGLSSLTSRVRSVVATGRLTRHKTGDGSCNREIRVVLGILLFPCTQYQLPKLSSFRTTSYYAIFQLSDLALLNNWMSATWIPQSVNHISSCTDSLQYVRSTHANNITSILHILERTISCKLIVRALISGHTHSSNINRSTGA